MLNLLPPEVKQRYHYASIVYSTSVAYVLILAVLGLGFTALTTYNYVQSSSLSEKQAKVSQLKKTRQSKIALSKEAGFIEDRLKASTSLPDKRQWTDIINRLASATPTAIVLKSTKIAVQKDETVTATLSGTTKDQRAIVLFRDKLEADEHYEKVSIQSISESGSPEDKSYSFTLMTTYNEKDTAKQ